jgi:hypothetical protein
MINHLDAARKNRERIEQERLKEKAGGDAKVSSALTGTKQETVSLKPAASKELEDHEPGVTRDEFFDVLKQVTKPITNIEKGKKPQDNKKAVGKLSYGLSLLKEDVIEGFKREYQDKLSRYGKDTAIDAYMETLIDRNALEDIARLLNHWMNWLDIIPDSPQKEGATMALLSLAEICSVVDGMYPGED